jgi:hypothetical protein
MHAYYKLTTPLPHSLQCISVACSLHGMAFSRQCISCMQLEVVQVFAQTAYEEIIHLMACDCIVKSGIAQLVD